jgi:putative hydrolase of the HAD superfamily
MKAILFDYGGTIDSDGRAWLERFRPFYAEAGVDPGPAGFDRAFYDSDDSLSKRFSLGGLSLEKTLILQTRCVLESLAPGKTALAEAIAGRFLEESREAFRRNRPMLERLSRRYRLAVVSNFYGNLRPVLESEGLLELFGVVADSGAVGALKPDAALFMHALKALGCDPASALMVGDSIPRDMRGAEALGMAHALLAPKEKPSCCAAALRLTELTGLEEALASRITA